MVQHTNVYKADINPPIRRKKTYYDTAHELAKRRVLRNAKKRLQILELYNTRRAERNTFCHINTRATQHKARIEKRKYYMPV